MNKFNQNIIFKLDKIQNQKEIIDLVDQCMVFFLQKNSETIFENDKLKIINLKLIIPDNNKFILFSGDMYWNEFYKSIIFEPKNFSYSKIININEILKINIDFEYEKIDVFLKIKAFKNLIDELNEDKYKKIDSKDKTSFESIEEFK